LRCLFCSESVFAIYPTVARPVFAEPFHSVNWCLQDMPSSIIVRYISVHGILSFPFFLFTFWCKFRHTRQTSKRACLCNTCNYRNDKPHCLSFPLQVRASRTTRHNMFS
jgi:hypothetical protein